MSDTLFFLQINFSKAGNVEGESTMGGFEKQIEVESFRWSMKVKEVREAVDGRASNAVSHQNLTLTSWFDLSTTNLLKCLETRDKFTLARLSCVHPIQPEDRPRDIVVMELRNGFVENLNLDLSGGKVGRLKTDIQLSYTGLGLDYYPARSTRDGRGRRMTFTTQVSTVDGS